MGPEAETGVVNQEGRPQGVRHRRFARVGVLQSRERYWLVDQHGLEHRDR